MVWIFPSRLLTFCTEKVANLNLYKNIDYFLLNGSAKQTLANLSSAHVNSQAKCLPVHVQTSHIKRIKLFFFVRAVARNRPTEALVSVISFAFVVYNHHTTLLIPRKRTQYWTNCLSHKFFWLRPCIIWFYQLR